MKIVLLLLAICIFLITGTSLKAATDPQSERPNIIFILADDLGWRDTGYGGSELYRTPNIDAFAKKGMVFTQAYAASPLCSPTRASVLTGLHPARIGITFPDCHFPKVILEKGLDPKPDSLLKWIGAQSLTRLDTNYITLPEVLKTAGYATGHFGKWHLGNNPYDPRNQGFDEDFPQWSWVPGPGKYYAPWRWGVSGGADKGRPGKNIEDRTMDEAIKFLEANTDKPFFLNYWAWSVHGPQETSRDLIEKYRSSITPGMAQRHPHYPGMIETLDNNIGRLLKAVEDLGLEKNTIIVFVSDNGGMHWNSRQVRPPTPSTSNAPLRAGKGTIYDGGTRVPCIVYWPGVTPPESTSDALISSIDWYPTLLDIVGLRSDQAQQPDGVSLVDVLRGKPMERKTIYCHYPQGEGWFMPGHQPATYVRDGEWKLIRFYCDHPDQTDRYELYNIQIDPGERHDLAALFPDTVVRLNVLIDQFLAETQAVVPIPNPEYFRKKYPIPAIPSMATWGMDTGIVNLATAYTPFDVLVGLRSVGRHLDIMEDSVRFRIKDIAIHAARKNIGIVADLDPRMALPTFERRYPDDLQQVIVMREMKKKELNDAGSITIPSRTLQDHYHRPYQTRTGGFVKAYGYNLTREGLIDGKSLRDISASIRTLSSGKEMVRLEYVPEKSHRFTETLLMVSFTYLYPDVFSPNLAAFQSDIFRKYAPLPLAGAHNDEWGFPASLTEPSLTDEYWYSPHMAAAYRKYTADKRDLLNDFILMHKGIRGKEEERLKAFNLFGEFVRERNAEIEEHFYNEVKKAYGPNGIVGVHPTWFPYPERREYKKNGLNWWVAKRDLAQTDEVVPFAIRTSLSKKWKSPVWYNMFYRYGLPEGATNADDYANV